MSGADRPVVLLAAAAYLVVTAGIAVWAWRRTRTTRDYFLAGRRLGLWVTAAATMSTAFSGFVFLGGPGLAYRLGIASLWIVVPLGFTAALLCTIAGRRLHGLADASGALTLPGALRAHFGSGAVGGAAGGAILIGCVGYLAAQFLALGLVVEAIFGVAFVPALLLGATIVVAYSIAGGMIASVYTDLFQGLLMAITAVAVFFTAIGSAGGWREMLASIAASERFGTAFLEATGTVPLTTALGFFFLFGIGVLGQPQMLHKLMMLDDARSLRRLPFVLGGGQSLCILLWLGIGLAVPALVAGGALAPLERPDEATPTFLLHFAPPLLAGVVFAGVLAAIMSTVDALLNIAAGALVRDLPEAGGRRPLDTLAAARGATLLVALAAIGLALAYDDLIALLGTFAFGTFAAALAPTIAIGLGRPTRAGAVTTSIVAGATLNVALELLARQGLFTLAPGAIPGAFALALSFALLLAFPAPADRAG